MTKKTTGCIFVCASLVYMINIAALHVNMYFYTYRATLRTIVVRQIQKREHGSWQI